MKSRLDLQNLLEELLESNNVYYQPPENLKMSYPCIRYSKKDINTKYADNIKYNNKNCYELIVISRLPDNEVINKILELPYTEYDRHYINNNLNHDIIIIYY